MFSNNKSSSYNQFSTNQGSSTTTNDSFLESNTLVSKFLFLLLVIFVFIILLKIGANLLSWWFSPNPSPLLINGIIKANQTIIIPQDPSSNGVVPILRSQNQNEGIEFTWSVWIFIEDLKPLGQYKHIFYKGNDNLLSNGLNYPNNAPGLYIAPNTNNLVVMMNTYTNINEEITIPDIPLNKWVNVIIRCHNTTLDAYINGVITRSVEMSGVPKQNYGNVFVGMNGGFDGFISNLQYFNYALAVTQINNLVSTGPNLKTASASNMYDKNADYLSLRWYLFGSHNMYNP
jgi:hypothetical protein